MQILAYQPDPASWGEYYAGLNVGDLDATHDYTAEEMPIGDLAPILASYPSSSAASAEVGYFAQFQGRHNLLNGIRVPPEDEEGSTFYSGYYFQNSTDSQGTSRSLDEASQLTAAYLLSQIGSVPWAANTFPPLREWDDALGTSTASESSSDFHEYPGYEGRTSYDGQISQSRSRVFATSLSHEPFERQYIRVTQKRPSGADPWETISGEPVSITIPKGKYSSGRLTHESPMMVGNYTRTILISGNVSLAIPNEETVATPPVIVASNYGPEAPENNENPAATDAEIDIACNGRLVPPEKKTTEGGWVVLNFDDDDGRGNYDHGNTSATPDLEFTGEIAKENDMIRVGITKVSMDSNTTVKYRFKYDDTNIRLWKNANRTGQVTSEQTEITMPANGNFAVAYVEGIKPHDDDEGTMVTAQLKIGPADWHDVDKAKIRVAHPIIVLYMEGMNWARSDAEPVAEFARSRISKGADNKPDPIYLRSIVNPDGDTFMIPGITETNKNVCYSITGLFDQRAYRVAKLALKTEGTNIAFNGHANWGVGFAFGTNFANFDKFFWAAGGGQAACKTKGFHEHPQLSPWVLIGQDLMPNFAAAGIWNGMHAPAVQNRVIEGVPVTNLKRFPNMENPIVEAGQTFSHHHEILTSGTGASMNLLYHYLANPDIDGEDAQEYRSILIQPGSSDVPPVSALKYKSLMLTQCNSYRNYIESFKHGKVIGTWYFISDRFITQTYVIQTVDGKSAAQMEEELEKLETNPIPNFNRGMFEISTFANP
jgi:hypothetical protein